MDRLELCIRDRVILNLLGQYLRRTAERGGWFWDCERCISLGCPLSPLIGAFFLDQLDRRMTGTGLFYVRFMDDILVLAPTRWKLRRAVTLVNKILGSLRLEKHPDRPSSAGSSAVSISSAINGLAEATIQKFGERAARLYEQEREQPNGSSRLGVYVRRWVGWAKGGVEPPNGHGNAGRA